MNSNIYINAYIEKDIKRRYQSRSAEEARDVVEVELLVANVLPIAHLINEVHFVLRP